MHQRPSLSKTPKTRNPHLIIKKRNLLMVYILSEKQIIVISCIKYPHMYPRDVYAQNFWWLKQFVFLLCMGDITKRHWWNHNSAVCHNLEWVLCGFNWRKMFEGETYCVESLAQAKEPPGVVEVTWSRGGSKKILLKVQRSDIINTQIHKSKLSCLSLFCFYLWLFLTCMFLNPLDYGTLVTALSSVINKQY